MIFQIRDNRIAVISAEALPTGTAGTLQAEFQYTDSEWSGLTLKGCFKAGKEGIPVGVPLSDKKCVVPWEVLSIKDKPFYAGLYGYNEAGKLVKNTPWIKVDYVEDGAIPSMDPAQNPELVEKALEAAVADYVEKHPVGVDEEISETSSRPVANKTIAAALSSLSEDIANKIKDMDLGDLTASSKIGEPEESDIPRIYFSNGTLPTTKTATTMKFMYRSKTESYDGYVEIKCQGNSSMNYPKKNFTIKTYKDSEKAKKLKINFRKWGEQSKFVLKANWIDISHSRNIVSAQIWGDVVKSRRTYPNLPEELRTSPNHGAVNGFPVLVFANGVYQGRYTLNIPKDKWMSNMDEDNVNHCILCGENYVSGCFRASANINGSDWSDELHDTVPNNIKTRWNEVISFVMDSSDEDFRANLKDYIDVTSLLDYFIFGMVSNGLDAFGKNQLFFTYDGQKWIASMYDMDSTWGLYWNGSKFVSDTYARTDFEDFVSSRGGNLLFIRVADLLGGDLKARYAELKNGALSVENILDHFERFCAIASSDLVKEDYATTTGSGKFTGIPSKDTNNIHQIRDYVLKRYAFCDTYFDSLTDSEALPDEPVVETVPCTGITLSASSLTFDNEDAQTLTATVTPSNTTDKITWSVSPSGICTVSNGVVTPQKNGSCGITATCGNYSASCNVSVDTNIETKMVYELAEETVLDRTNAIDTGVVFKTKPQSVLLYIDLDDPRLYGNGTVLLGCEPFSVSRWATGFRLDGVTVTDNIIPTEYLSHSKATAKNFIVIIYDGAKDGQNLHFDFNKYHVDAHIDAFDANTFYVGAGHGLNTSCGARVRALRIYNGIVTDDEINAFKAFTYPYQGTYGNYNVHDVESVYTRGEKFSLPIGEVQYDNQTIFANLNTHSENESIYRQNILSVGENISDWTCQGFHMYKPLDASHNGVILGIIFRGVVQVQIKSKDNEMFNNNDSLKIAVNSNGIYINGAKLVDSAGVGENFTMLQGSEANAITAFSAFKGRSSECYAGSQEGQNRSYINEYKEFRLYDTALTAEQMIALTTV